MGDGGVQGWRVLVVWVVLVALFAGAVGGGVLLPEGATAQVAAPVAAGSVPGVELTVGGGARSVEVADYFTGTVASYGATSGDVGVVSVALSGSAVSLSPAGAGSTTVKVTASNASGSAVQVFGVKVLPAGCVVSLGTLAAGSITTSSGSWDRDDGCRSSNAGHRSHLYSAGYVSFTVSEAVVARFSLSATEGKRLFLLAGAGTGGRVLGSSLILSKTAPTSLWRTLSPGSYTLEATTYYAAREADFSVEIDSMALVPPAGCVTSKGTLAAGSTTSVSGSWARSEGCRSQNAATNRRHRHYADYVTFTVPEAVEARVTLASSVGKRLYLLDGAGTGGAVVGWPVIRYAERPAVLSRKLSAGTYTLEVTTYDATQEGDYTLTIALAATAPTKGDALQAREIPIGPDVAQIDVSGAFNGAVDTYSATSGDTSVVTASVAGSVVTLSGVAAGAATVTVTATNTAGSVSQTFTVTVSSIAAAPHTAGTLAARAVTVGGTLTIDVAAAFGGAVDSYGAASGDTTVATVTTTGSEVTLSGVAAGAATVTVTATNRAGSAERSFGVTVTPVAPSVGVVLAAQTVTAGESVEVDAAGAFGGAVDSYEVTSNNAAVVDVALAGSVVTLTGVAAGRATVTVVASNAGGGASQTMTVTVGLPPAPTFGLPFASQSLQVTETLTVDVAAGFVGRIDSYTARSGDTDRLTVTVDGSTVALWGASVGSTTVTVTAVNAAGRATRSFPVTVNALTPPQAAYAPIDRTVAVGEELPIHVADAFSGVIATYGATSDNTNILTATVDGPTVTVTGVAAGAATVTLEAVNDAGRAAQTFTVTVQVPDELAVAVSAPSHCLGSEGVLAPGGGRRGVGFINLTYHVTGGAGPYTITSPDTPGTTHTEPTGTLTVPCAQRGIDLTTAGPDVNVVEAGPRTITLVVTDNTGVTTNADIGIEVAENAYTTEYNDGQMHGGNTYVLGTPDQWVLITLPDGLTLQFEGLSEGHMAHFAEPATGTEIILDWHTGQEIRRTTPPTAHGDNARATSTAATSTAPVAVSKPAGLTYGANAEDWRPYPDLPEGAQVAVHPNMLAGASIPVCTLQDQPGFPDDIKAGIDAWNIAVQDYNESINKRFRRSPGFTRTVFEWVEDCPTDSLHIELRIVAESVLENSCAHTPPAKADACAHTKKSVTNPPLVSGNLIEIGRTSSILGSKSDAERVWIIIHELGHFLGLGDYNTANESKCGHASTAPDNTSAMAIGKCRKYAVQVRDLRDLHAVYHPGARVEMSFAAHGSGGWKLYTGRPPVDMAETPNFVSNAVLYLVFRRAFDSTGVWGYWGWFSRGMSDDWLYPGTVPGEFILPTGSVDEIAGFEFAVFGITGGDIEQTPSRVVGEHAMWQARVGDKEWSLGTPLVVYGPPAKPVNLVAGVSGSDVVLSWGSVPGATHYHVHVYRFNETEPHRSEEFTADPGVCVMRVKVSGLERRLTHVFRVQAKRAGVDMLSELSERVSARVSTTDRSRQAVDGASDSGGDAERSASCSVPVEVSPVVGESASCPSDGFSWARRAVGEGFVCDRLDTAASVPGSTVASCPEVVPRYARVTVGGVEKCRRVLVAAPAESLGPPECEAGFVPVGGGASCSRTDSVPATATTRYSCPKGYRLVTVQGTFCYRSTPAKASPEYVCSTGYSLVRIPLGGQYCRKSVPATATKTRECRSGYSLVRFFVSPGVFGHRCERSTPAAVSKRYVCSSGYSLVRIPLGGQYCRRLVPATPRYSCEPGYTRSGASCYRYTYRELTGSRCPAGYTTVYDGLVFLCRKKVTVPAKVTHSCTSGTLSGRNCVFTATPTIETTYSCTSGTLSGTKCVHTAAPTIETTYSCTSGTLSGTKCVFTDTPKIETTYSCTSGTLSGTKCVHTDKPTTTVTYDCDDAPAGYTLSDTDCVKTITKPPTRPTIYTCTSPYKRVPPTFGTGAPTCEHIDIINATVTTTPRGCPAVPPGEPPYQLHENTIATTTSHTCERTITINATIEPTYTCPTGYTPKKTVNDNQTKHTCRLNPPTN